MMSDATKLIGLPAANIMVLAVTSPSLDVWLRVCQIALALATIIFTALQITKMVRRLRREQRVADMVAAARRLCEKAKSGDCPMSGLLKDLERE